MLLSDIPAESDTTHALSLKGAYDICAKTIIVDFGEVDSLPVTKTVEGVTADMVVLQLNLSCPSAQTSTWLIDINNENAVTIRGSVNGKTNVELILGTPIRRTAV